MFKLKTPEILRVKPDESDLLLCFGAEAVFVAIALVYMPLAILFVGILFFYLANLHAKHEAFIKSHFKPGSLV